MGKKNFSEKCYAVLKKVPAGKVTTYKEIAHALNTKAYRAIGIAMKINKNAPIVPCHRVVCTDGKIGGYYGNDIKNIKKKIELLRKEGVVVNGKVDLRRHLFKFRKE